MVRASTAGMPACPLTPFASNQKFISRIKIGFTLLFIFCCFCLSKAQSKKDKEYNLFSVSFKLIAKMIFAEATVDGQTGYFIVDTGAPELILNKSYFNSQRGAHTIQDARGYSANLQTTFVSFSLAAIHIKNKRAFVADLKHLERDRHIKILGVIGQSVFKNHELILDYDSKELIFIKLDKKGNRLSISPFYSEPARKIAFKLNGHLPCIEAAIGGTFFTIGIDSGAGLNVLDVRFQEQLAPYCSDFRQANIQSFSRLKTSSKAALLESVELEEMKYPAMRTAFREVDALSKGLGPGKVHGLFGYEFLRHYTISINYKKKELSIWDADINESLITRFDK